MAQRMITRRGPGRPYIGPKMQAHVPEEIAKAVVSEAQARRCREADVWRELIVLGWPSWRKRSRT